MEFDFDEDETNMRFKTEKTVPKNNKFAQFGHDESEVLESEVNITD